MNYSLNKIVYWRNPSLKWISLGFLINYTNTHNGPRIAIQWLDHAGCQTYTKQDDKARMRRCLHSYHRTKYSELYELLS